jgi:hypothetical protein
MHFKHKGRWLEYPSLCPCASIPGTKALALFDIPCAEWLTTLMFAGTNWHQKTLGQFSLYLLPKPSLLNPSFSHSMHLLYQIDRPIIPVLRNMCDYTQVEFRCGHCRYTVRAWCSVYETTHIRCRPNVVAVEFRYVDRNISHLHIKVTKLIFFDRLDDKCGEQDSVCSIH